MSGICVSFNFRYTTNFTKDTLANCDLIYATKNQFPNYFVGKIGYVYYELAA